jgi:hypothetical protein
MKEEDTILLVDGEERQGMSTAAQTLSQYLKLKERRGRVSDTTLTRLVFQKNK